MNIIKRGLFCLLVLVLSLKVSDGQQDPFRPVSYRVFSPFIFNPAIAGSKDFCSLDIISSSLGKSNSQIISCNTRIKKTTSAYFSSPGDIKFTNIALGGSLFNDLDGKHRNIGLSGTFSYHIPLDKDLLSFISIGASFKGIYNVYAGDPDLVKPAKNTFLPNADLGVYYYSPKLYAGVSSTNLIGSPKDPDSTGIPVSRQYFLIAGYKIILNRSLNIVLEPSIILNVDDSFTNKKSNIVQPQLKVYLQEFCLGTYFNDFDKISFFFQYRYPKFYLATYFEIPRGSPYFKKNLLAEFAVGINLSNLKLKSAGHNHW
jgi:type IX secretion system PorP/SprF family membrane protein